jgi:chromosome segregation ATPase
LSCQTRDSERRIFDYVRQSQEADDKLRKNAILVKDMASERDKFKKLQEEKEQEIGDLAFELKVTRQKLTDLTLIEEKIVHFISDTDLQVEANKRTLHDYLRNLLRTIGASDSLCSKVNMRRRDKGYELQDKFAQRPKTSVEVWGQMVGFKDSQVVFGEAISYLTELIDIFLQTSVELNADFSKKERQVSQLESKLGSIHSVDYQAQESLGQLKQELAELR